MTWLVGLPSSSSHALMGGLIGATIASAGTGAVHGDVLVTKVLLPAVAAPIVAGVAALLATRFSYTLSRNADGADGKAATRASASARSPPPAWSRLAHGTNDAQEDDGHHHPRPDRRRLHRPRLGPATWVILSAGLAIAMGTYIGGWRIIRTMGKGLTDLRPQQGFAAQTSAAAVILASSHIGFSLSTTHAVSGSVMGAGLAARGGVVRWSTATRMFVAWGLTLPAAALVGALAESVTGLGDWGTALVAVFLVPPAPRIWLLSRRQVVDASNVNEFEEPAGVVTAAIAAVTPPPSVALSEGLTATIPSPPVAPAPVATPDPATPAPPPAAPSEPAPPVRRIESAWTSTGQPSAPSSASARGHRGPGGRLHPSASPPSRAANGPPPRATRRPSP